MNQSIYGEMARRGLTDQSPVSTILQIEYQKLMQEAQLEAIVIRARDMQNSTDPLKIDTFAPLATMRPEIRFETLGVAPKIPNLSFLELEQKQKHRRPWWVRVLLFLRIASVRKTED